MKKVEQALGEREVWGSKNLRDNERPSKHCGTLKKKRSLGKNRAGTMVPGAALKTV